MSSTDGASAGYRGQIGARSAWAHAVAHNIAVLPLSAAVEEAFTRQALHRMLAGLGYAQLAVRLGVADPHQEATPHTPRLPASETITILS